jgi:hypothetical protein
LLRDDLAAQCDASHLSGGVGAGESVDGDDQLTAT